MDATEKIKTLVIDDEPDLLELTKLFLEGHSDISVEVAGSSSMYQRVVSDRHHLIGPLLVVMASAIRSPDM